MRARAVKLLVLIGDRKPSIDVSCPKIQLSNVCKMSAAETNLELDVPKERQPRHVAIIMDGNGRWAQRQGLPRIRGHQQGAKTVRRITEECSRLGVEQVTLYCLSSENWKRPAEELEFLMFLLSEYLVASPTMCKKKWIARSS